MGIELALKRMIRIARNTNYVMDQMKQIGFGDEFLFSIYSEAIDAIYALVGEQTHTLEESLTWKAINDKSLSDMECRFLLMKEYEKNRGDAA